MGMVVQRFDVSFINDWDRTDAGGGGLAEGAARGFGGQIEANDAARRFYERLGGAHVGTSNRLDPAGGSAPNCRYVWTNPAALIGGG
jgi:hypothetical protein